VNPWRRAERDPPRADEIELRDTGQDIGLLFRFFSVRHGVTEIAGMSAIEGLRYRLAQRRAADIGDQHRRPGDGLESKPMAPDRQAKR